MANKLIFEKDEIKTMLWGGFDEAQRRVFCVLFDFSGVDGNNDNVWDFFDSPITAVTISLPKNYEVSHRDVLGSLMGLKLKREAVGDILIEERRVVVFLQKTAAQPVLSELDKIGRVGVKCVEGMPKQLPPAFKTEQHEGVVASMRLDCIVAELVNKSRSETAEIISSGLVSVNSVQCENFSMELKAGDSVSIRGFGKFKLDNDGAATKKGRLRISYKKYI